MKRLVILITFFGIACQSPGMDVPVLDSNCVPTYWDTRAVVDTNSWWCRGGWAPRYYRADGIDSLLIADPDCPQLKKMIYFEWHTKPLHSITLNCSTYVFVYERLCYGVAVPRRYNDILSPGGGR